MSRTCRGRVLPVRQAAPVAQALRKVGALAAQKGRVVTADELAVRLERGNDVEHLLARVARPDGATVDHQ